MKVADIEKRVAKFIENLNSERSINATARVIASEWKKYDKDRTYLKVEVTVENKTVTFDAGFINNETSRYNKAQFCTKDTHEKLYMNGIDFSKKDDTAAFAVVYELDELQAKKEENIVKIDSENYELPADVELADNKIYADKKGNKYIIARKKDDIDYLYAPFRNSNGKTIKICDWDYEYQYAVDNLEDIKGELEIV